MFKRVITLREALEDFLREQGLSVDDVLDAMDENPEGIIRSLLRRVELNEEEARNLEKIFTSRQLNLIIFTIQVFYLSTFVGLYKGALIYPPLEMVLGRSGRISKRGFSLIVKSLGLKPGMSYK